MLCIYTCYACIDSRRYIGHELVWANVCVFLTWLNVKWKCQSICSIRVELTDRVVDTAALCRQRRYATFINRKLTASRRRLDSIIAVSCSSSSSSSSMRVYAVGQYTHACGGKSKRLVSSDLCSMLIFQTSVRIFKRNSTQIWLQLGCIPYAWGLF